MDQPPTDEVNRGTEANEFLRNDDVETFLDSECGKTGLTLVAHSAAVIAEIFRLSNHIPDVFLFSKVVSKDKKDNKFTYISAEGKSLSPEEVKIRFFEQEKYLQVLYSYDYLKNRDAYDERIKGNMELFDLDQNFQQNYMEVIERFYQLFESIYNYWRDLTNFLEEINEGKHIDYSMEQILQDDEGKRLLLESLYHYGVMLLLLDRLIPSIARERIVTCYVRYKDTALTEKTQKVVKLCKSTGFLFNKATNMEVVPSKYPNDYFNRFKINPALIETFINLMKDDDIFNMISVFGNKPQYRSCALAQQAQMIFVLIPFCPAILENHDSKMREICDKHFADNWVIPIYNGVHIDLLSYWSSFTSATKAMANNISEDRVTSLAKYFTSMVATSIERIKNYLVEGQLQEKEALDSVKELLGCLRDANHTMRWIMLHQHTRNKKMREVVCSIIDRKALVDLLLDLSKFEHLLKERLTEIVTRKK